jgi:Bacterial Ig-like domain
LRKLIIAILAVPVLAVIYAATALRRPGIMRATAALGLGAAIGLGVVAFVRPTLTTATPPTDIVPLTAAAFRTSVGTDVELQAAATIGFSTPMERASVEAALDIEPPTAVELRWNADDTAVAIVPVSHWAVDTFHTITVQSGALAGTGRPLTKPVRAAFLTRGPTTAVLAATDKIAKRVALDTAFSIGFDRAVDPRSVARAVRLEPAAKGKVTVESDVDGLPRYVFTPRKALKANTRYTLIVDGVRDRDGVPVARIAMAVRTAVAPEVVRFRPRARTQDVARPTDISVRFSTPMDRASTKKAFKVLVDGKAIQGKITFGDNDTVLVFDPARNFAYDTRVVASVSRAARSADGVALRAAERIAFRTELKPVAKSRSTSVVPISSGGSSGGSTGGGSWASVERYYMGLMNCTRTGGWVTSGGSCSSPGGRNVAPLRLDAGISSKVARPYAKKLAVSGACTHFSGGNPGDRLRRAGYTSYRWAENLGCRSGNPMSAVLGSHLFFQSEKSYNGGHYVNMMNSKYDRAGVGVWVSGGRVRLVVDFYHP